MEKLSTFYTETKILRTCIAIGLIVMSFMSLFSGFLLYLMLSLSILISGFDLFVEAYKDIRNKHYLDSNLILILSSVILFLIGFNREAAIVVVIYQLGLFFVSKLNDIVRSKSINIINPDEVDILSNVYDSLDEDDSDILLMEHQMRNTTAIMFIVMIAFAILYAALMPLIKNLSVTASIHRALSIFIISTPLSMILSYRTIGSVAICNAASNGIIFRKAAHLELFQDAKRIILDEKLSKSKNRSEIIYCYSDSMPEETFLNFVFHVVYHSDQDFSVAIRESLNYSYQSGLILGAIDIPGYGIKASINGMQIIFGNKQLCNKFNVIIPPDISTDIDGIKYYLCIEKRCVGIIVLSEETDVDCSDFVTSFKEFGKECLFSDEIRDENRKRGIVCSIFYPTNSDKCKSDINIQIDSEPTVFDGCIIPDYLDNISMIPYLSRRVTEVALHNSIFAYAFKIIIVILSVLGFCVPWIAITIDLIVTMITVIISMRLPAAGVLSYFRKK